MAEIVEGAFVDSLRPVLADRTARLRLLAHGIALRCTVGAFIDTSLVGVVGYKTAEASVYECMTFKLLHRELGAGAIKAKLALKVLDRPVEAGTLRIEFVAVDQEFWGRGVGGVLLRATERRACERSARLLELHVEPSNGPARRLYEREGFRDAPAGHPRAPRGWIQSQTDIRMTKELLCTTS